ncbi:MAG: hypothetical protein ACPGVT_10975 [Maricaulaceae bacterium]
MRQTKALSRVTARMSGCFTSRPLNDKFLHMRLSFLSFFRKLRSPYRMKTWGHYDPVSDVKLSGCIGVIEYLKDRANIPPEQVIWNQEKIKDLVTSIKRRKIGFFIVAPVAALLGVTAAILLILCLICAWAGDGCVSRPIMRHLSAAFIAVSFAAVWLLRVKTSLSRDRRLTQISDYLLPDLTVDQKRDFIDAAKALKVEHRQLYIAVNHDVLLSVPLLSWTAENWFLLLTDNERHRFGIWLDGSYPLGKLYVYNPKRASRKTGTVWDKISLPHANFLFSDKDRLGKAIKAADILTLEPHQTVWREGLIALYENHEDYEKYLDKIMDSTDRERFFGKFTPIFAVLSKSYKRECDAVGAENINVAVLGESGAKKFLRGRNDNIEKWIKTLMPR